jgi:hypothetical protein
MVEEIHRACKETSHDMAVPICGGEAVCFDYTGWS